MTYLRSPYLKFLELRWNWMSNADVSNGEQQQSNDGSKMNRNNIKIRQQGWWKKYYMIKQQNDDIQNSVSTDIILWFRIVGSNN